MWSLVMYSNYFTPTVYNHTVNMERFTGLNIRGFSRTKFSQESFHHALASSVNYLTIAKYLRKNFRGTLKNHENHESLAQRIFPYLQWFRKPQCFVI